MTRFYWQSDAFEALKAIASQINGLNNLSLYKNQIYMRYKFLVSKGKFFALLRVCNA